MSQSKKISKSSWSQLKDDLKKLANPESVGVAMVGYGISISTFVVGTWSLMYFYSPLTRLRPRYPRLNQMYLNAEMFIERKINRLPHWIRDNNRINWSKLITSGAEAWVIRQPLLPVYYPACFAIGIYSAQTYSRWRWPEKYIDEWNKLDKLDQLDQLDELRHTVDIDDEFDDQFNDARINENQNENENENETNDDE